METFEFLGDGEQPHRDVQRELGRRANERGEFLVERDDGVGDRRDAGARAHHSPHRRVARRFSRSRSSAAFRAS